MTHRKKWKDFEGDGRACNGEKQPSLVLSSDRQLTWFSRDGGVAVTDSQEYSFVIILNPSAKSKGCTLSMTICCRTGHLSFPVFLSFTLTFSQPWAVVPVLSVPGKHTFSPSVPQSQAP